MVKHQAPVKSLLTCPECRLELRLFGIETETAERELYTFECTNAAASKSEASRSNRPPQNLFGNARTHLARMRSSSALLERAMTGNVFCRLNVS